MVATNTIAASPDITDRSPACRILRAAITATILLYEACADLRFGDDVSHGLPEMWRN